MMVVVTTNSGMFLVKLNHAPLSNSLLEPVLRSHHLSQPKGKMVVLSFSFKQYFRYHWENVSMPSVFTMLSWALSGPMVQFSR